MRIFGGLSEKNHNLIKNFIFQDKYNPFRINNFQHIGWPDPYPEWNNEQSYNSYLKLYERIEYYIEDARAYNLKFIENPIYLYESI